MKKTKIDKGITLIALIITIIILLILAVVTIGSIKNNNIITYAQNAANKYSTEKENEESVLGQYEDEIAKYDTDVGTNSTFKPISEKWAELDLEKPGVPVYVNYDMEYSNTNLPLWDNMVGLKITLYKNGGLLYEENNNGRPISTEFQKIVSVYEAGLAYGESNFMSFATHGPEHFIAVNFKENNTADVYYCKDKLIKSIAQEGITYLGTISVAQ